MSSISSIASWLDANPMYAIGALVGLCLGIYYGFDGWRGSTEEVELKDSPRVKNLLWILGGAFSAVIGDVKAVDPATKKPILLLFYFVAFLIGSIGVVIFWGMIVLVDAMRLSERVHRTYSVVDAVGDYFYFGYRKYRDRKGKVISGQRADFLAGYLTQVTYSIGIAGADIGPEERAAVARELLRSITAIVHKYRGYDPDVRIRTNLMMNRECSDENKHRLQFVVADQEVDWCLELFSYDNDDVQRDLVIPLPKSGHVDDALPGAPIAFLGETPVIIDDTRSIEYSKSTNGAVKTAMEVYFASKDARFRSFASLRVIRRGAAIGVVNIECSQTHVFGTNDESKKELVEYLFPFCSILGILLVEL